MSEFNTNPDYIKTIDDYLIYITKMMELNNPLQFKEFNVYQYFSGRYSAYREIKKVLLKLKDNV